MTDEQHDIDDRHDSIVVEVPLTDSPRLLQIDDAGS